MLPQAPRRDGGPPRKIHWTYVQIPRGSELVGWLGAKPQWIWLHPSQQSKPCLHEMTAGELDCPYCKSGKLPEVKGFIGVYRSEDAKPVGFWVNEDQREQLDRLPFLTRVAAARQKTKGSPVAVRVLLEQTPRYESTLPERRVWSDTTLSLLALLKCPLLQEWMRQTHGLNVPAAERGEGGDQGGAAAVRAADAPPPEPGEDVYLLGSSWFGRLPPEQRAEVLARRNRAFIESAKKPPANGNGNGKH